MFVTLIIIIHSFKPFIQLFYTKKWHIVHWYQNQLKFWAYFTIIFPLCVSIVMMDGVDWLSLEAKVFICPQDTDSTWNCGGSVNLPHTSPSVSVAQLWQKGTQRAMGKLCLIPKSQRESVAGWQWGLPAPHRHSFPVNTGHQPHSNGTGGAGPRAGDALQKRPPMYSAKMLLLGCDYSNFRR